MEILVVVIKVLNFIYFWYLYSFWEMISHWDNNSQEEFVMVCYFFGVFYVLYFCTYIIPIPKLRQPFFVGRHYLWVLIDLFCIFLYVLVVFSTKYYFQGLLDTFHFEAHADYILVALAGYIFLCLMLCIFVYCILYLIYMLLYYIFIEDKSKIPPRRKSFRDKDLNKEDIKKEGTSNEEANVVIKGRVVLYLNSGQVLNARSLKEAEGVGRYIARHIKDHKNLIATVIEIDENEKKKKFSVFFLELVEKKR
jgi:hypothetical protein